MLQVLGMRHTGQRSPSRCTHTRSAHCNQFLFLQPGVMTPTGSPIIEAFCRGQQQRRAQTPVQLPSYPSATNESPDHAARIPSRTTEEQTGHTANDLSVRPAISRKRAVQHVLTRAQRVHIVKWMISEAAENGEKLISSKTAKKFPEFFRGNEKANLQRASRLWKNRDMHMRDAGKNGTDKAGTGTSITRVTEQGLKRSYLKVRPGRGRKRSPWLIELHQDLLNEFDRMRKAGVKFSAGLLRTLALQLIQESQKDEYSANAFDTRSGKLMSSIINARWIQTFMERYGIVSRTQSGKLMVTPKKQELIHREVAYHLGVLCRELQSKKVEENDLCNADGTHFVINMDNYRGLAMAGEQNVKYVDVVSGNNGMTMMVRISGGRDSIVEAPFLIFQNKRRSYPIQGVVGDIPGVSYQSGPKGWFDRTVTVQWLREPRAIKKLPHGRKRVLYVYNCAGHAVTPESSDALIDINTELRYFPKNATDLCQPADSFVIQKIKDSWRKKWDAYKMKMIKEGTWAESYGKLPNPGKRFFLKLAADVVKEVNNMRDENGLTYARKAMIRCGMAPNVNGQWEILQLSGELQEIVKKYRDNFDGKEVYDTETSSEEDEVSANQADATSTGHESDDQSLET